MGIIETRRHAIMLRRERQITLNALAVAGGEPYVRERLWRAPNESDLSWFGDPARRVAGRLERTALVNDAGRVAAKINQYIFSGDIPRHGADPAFLADVTGDGESMDAFMERVNTAVTAAGWCWVQADRAPLPPGGAETLADKAPVRLRLWEAQYVSDWCLDGGGRVLWLVAKSTLYDNSDPRAEPRTGVVSTLYELAPDGGVLVTEECSSADAGLRLRTAEPLPGLREIPFVLVGRPSDRAWWFDGVERVQAQILNLDSMHNETLTESVYPQLVVPLSLVNSLEATLAERRVNGEDVVALVRELTVGRKTPVVEAGEDKGISRYIMPGGDCKLLTEEAARKRQLLFDAAGLALFSRETRQVQTAESKRFDQLDTNATLGNRVRLLADAERRVAALAGAFDPSVRAWEAQYPTSFDVTDVAALADAVARLDNLPSAGKVPAVRRFALKAAVRIAAESAGGLLTKDDVSKAMDDIDALGDDALADAPRVPAPPGDGTDADDDDI